MDLVSLLRRANRGTSELPRLRGLGIHVYRELVRLNRFFPPPRVLINGPGKSGTHLLADCVGLFPRMMFSGRHFSLVDFIDRQEDRDREFGRPPDPPLATRRLRPFLAAAPEGTFVTGHARYHDAFEALLRELCFAHMVLLRDPRDIVVSYVHFVMRERTHHHHRYFTQTLRTDAERLMAAITGFPRSDEAGPPLPSIGVQMAGHARWIGRPGVEVYLFERLVGPRGGGSREGQSEDLARISRQIDRPLASADLEQIAARMYSERSFTFRRGAIRDWERHFEPAHRAAFREVTGDLLFKLGYEKDHAWV
jgi:hypothetical protein